MKSLTNNFIVKTRYAAASPPSKCNFSRHESNKQSKSNLSMSMSYCGTTWRRVNCILCFWIGMDDTYSMALCRYTYEIKHNFSLLLVHYVLLLDTFIFDLNNTSVHKGQL